MENLENIENKINLTLKKLFGFTEFKQNQENVIKALLQQQDVFASMPTGGGKSLCYQLPAHILDGTCVVISPLIALMKDQVDSAKTIGINAEYINSSLTNIEVIEIIDRLKNNQVDLLYIAPERFAMTSFIELLKTIKICFFAIDEAHCISEWGPDFRPDYLLLSKIVKQFTNIPIAAFTATATKNVQNDIITKLNLRTPYIVRASFDRPNLFYQIEQKNDVDLQIFNFIQKHKTESGIIYRTTRKSVESTTDFLRENNIKVLPYHAGLDSEKRKEYQEAFNKDQVQVIVATIAFGMGIDKSNIRYVVHGDLPKSIEGYYQETGRAGRDGEPADCLLFYGRGDAPKIRFFIDQINNENERKVAYEKLNDLINFASLNICRRRQLLKYFNEEYTEKNCKMCDICTGELEQVDITQDAQITMSAIARTNQRFGAAHIVDIIYGANTKKIRELRHNEIKTYGIGRKKSKEYWRNIIDELLSQEILLQTEEKYPILKIAKSSIELLQGKEKCFTLRKKNIRKSQQIETNLSYNSELFVELQQIRKEIAISENVPPYIIFSDKTLHEMCRKYPTNPTEMLSISGVGEVKFSAYGEAFIKVIIKFLEQNPGIRNISEETYQPQVKKSPKKSETRDETWKLLNKGLTYKEIATQRGLTISTIINHMELLANEGKAIDIDLHISNNKKTEILKLFNNAKTSMLRPVVEASHGNINYEEARLVRIYLNQTAN